jgi:hypothetical protein
VHRIDFRDEQRNVGIHTMIPCVADDGIARAGKVLLRGSRDGRIERGENKITFEAGIETFDEKTARIFRNRAVKVPAHGFRISLTGGALGCGDFSELEPGMAGEKFYKMLSDQSGRA